MPETPEIATSRSLAGRQRGEVLILLCARATASLLAVSSPMHVGESS